MPTSMRNTLWAGLALTPALAMALFPDGAPLTTLDPALLLGLSWAVAVGALIGARGKFPPRHGKLQLLDPHCRVALPDCPSPAEIRRQLTPLLQAPPPLQDHGWAQEPETEAHALGRIIASTLATQGWRDLSGPGSADLRGLWLLVALLRAAPGKAGELAQAFRRPDAMLELRDRLAAITSRRDAWDRQCAAFEATSRLWAEPRPESLTDQLAALDRPDPDLWHRVIREFDPAQPEERNAALWCGRQLTCHRASVALLLHRLAQEDVVLDSCVLPRLDEILANWGAGRYSARKIGLAPADQVAGSAPAFARLLDRLAAQADSPRLPDPVGIFDVYDGRAPLPRPAWRLDRGLCAAPEPVDYLLPPA